MHILTTKHKTVLFITITILVLVISGLTVSFLEKKSTNNLSSTSKAPDAMPSEIMSDEEIKEKIDSTLEILFSLYYISSNEISKNNSDALFFDLMKKSMDDVNRLEKILPKADELAKSQDKVFSTTGLVLKKTIIELMGANTAWVNYLRTVDVESPEFSVNEFEYQTSLFGSRSHDSYLGLIEGASFLPYSAVRFPRNENDEIVINENIKKHFLIKIDELFSEAFIENKKFYKKTQQHYAVVVLVEQYKDFFNK